ncbi:hypothetical protein ES703_114201 [subsurface metagenome]
MTFAQARQEAISGLRALRAVYRKSDTAGEVFERSLDRLIEKRKKIVVSRELLPLIEKFRVFYSHVLDMEEALKICAEVLMKYEL